MAPNVPILTAPREKKKKKNLIVDFFFSLERNPEKSSVVKVCCVLVQFSWCTSTLYRNPQIENVKPRWTRKHVGGILIILNYYGILLLFCRGHAYVFGRRKNNNADPRARRCRGRRQDTAIKTDDNCREFFFLILAVTLSIIIVVFNDPHSSPCIILWLAQTDLTRREVNADKIRLLL